MTLRESVGRRTYLRIAGSVGVVATAGCTALGLGGGSDERTVLERPTQYEMLREARDNGDLDHPIHGDPLPDVTVPCALRGRDIATAELGEERHTLFTFIFVRCHAACSALTAALRHVQDDSADRGYADEIALVPITFDPENDTPTVLREYGERMGVDFDLDNWYFLRPETDADARAVVDEEFGCFFERNGGYTDGDEADHDDGGDNSSDGHDEMAFEHASMFVLANAGGHVERTYTGAALPSTTDLVDDVRAVVDGWG